MSKTQMKHIAFSKDELQLIDEIMQARMEHDRKVFGDKFVEKEKQKQKSRKSQQKNEKRS